MPAIRESVEPIYRLFEIRAYRLRFHWGNPRNKGRGVNFVSRKKRDGVYCSAQVGVDTGIGFQRLLGISGSIALSLGPAWPANLRSSGRRANDGSLPPCLDQTQF